MSPAHLTTIHRASPRTPKPVQFGLGLLWVSLVSLPLMAGVQEICDRTALTTGRGLGELAAEKFKARTRPVLIVLISALIVANALNISADLVAVGSGMNLLHAGPIWVWAIVAGAGITAAVIVGSFTQIARIFKVFALGFIGTGMLAVPVLAGSGAAGMAGLLGKRWGFSRSVRKAPVFYGLVAVGTLGGTMLSLGSANPIHLLVIVATINGIAAAPFLLLVMLIARDTTIMGEHRNGKVASTLGWLAFAVMAVAAVVMLSQYL